MGIGLTILVPRPGFESRPSAMRVWSPNHWTTREFPCHFFFFNLFLAAPDLCCYMVGFLLVVVCGLFTAGVFVVVRGL